MTGYKSYDSVDQSEEAAEKEHNAAYIDPDQDRQYHNAVPKPNHACTTFQVILFHLAQNLQ